MIFLPLTLFALSEGNAATNSAGWSAPYILICFGIAIIALAVFITTEFTIEEPLLDLRLISNHNFGLCILILLIFSMGMFGSTFLLPIYLQNSLGYTAVQAGSVFLPVGFIQGMVSPISGRLADKLNPKIPIIIGVILLGFSFYLNSFLSFLVKGVILCYLCISEDLQWGWYLHRSAQFLYLKYQGKKWHKPQVYPIQYVSWEEVWV